MNRPPSAVVIILPSQRLCTKRRRKDFPEKVPDRPKDPSNAFERWESVWTECLLELSTPGSHNRERWQTLITEIEQDWLANFFDYNEERGGVSGTDLLFMLRCAMRVCTLEQPEEQKTPLGVQDLTERFVELACTGCHHTADTQYMFPTDEEIDALDARISCFITQHYHSQLQIEAFMKRWEKPTDWDGDEIKQTKQAIDSLPESLKDRAYQLWRGCDPTAEPNSNVGWLWGMSPVELFNRYVPLAGRVMAQLLVERKWWHAFPQDTPAYIEPLAQSSIRRWFTDTTKVDSQDKMKGRYRDNLHELQIPMGGRLMAQRDASTRHEKGGSMPIIEQELGYHTAADLMKLDGIPLRQIVAESSPEQRHVCYDALLLTTFDHYLQHLDHVEFIAKHFMYPTWFVMNYRYYEKRAEANIPERYAFPILTLLRRKWCLFYRKHWIVNECLEDALLRWLMIMKKDFNLNYAGPQWSIGVVYGKIFGQLGQ